MRRARVDPEKDAAAVEAVWEGTMSLRHAAETSVALKSSIYKPLKGVVFVWLEVLQQIDDVHTISLLHRSAPRRGAATRSQNSVHISNTYGV